ncbi:hypothetical protein [Gaetbulibacter saemankumensis]|uniref:hypothetical protein n=1 Tax=Gaetbulibacter saemankumensis TaxID=311208 RepID=UPI000489FBAC|nr:hypothetical protein [Gaetbulibacter saemankumensis]
MKSFIYLLCFTCLISCSNTQENENCRFLLNVGVNVVVDLSLPQYSQLPFAGNSVYIPNVGNRGIIVASSGADYYAWDAADPNHIPSACSTLKNNDLEATCGCEDQNTYSLITGQILGNNQLPCSLRNYRVEQSGNRLIISN